MSVNLKSWLHGRIAKEFLWIGIGQVLAFLGSAITIRILTSKLGADEYGLLSLTLTVAAFPPQLIYGPFSQGAARFFVVAKEKGKLAEHFAIAARIFSATIPIILIVAFGASLMLGNALRSALGTKWSLLLGFACALAIVDGYSLILDATQNAARQRLVVSWHQNLLRWGRLGLAVLFIGTWARSSLEVLAAFLVASIIVAGSQSFFLFKIVTMEDCRKKSLDKPSMDYLKTNMLRFAGPFILWGLSSWAQASSDRWTLQAFWGASSVGVYTVLLQIGYTPIIFLGNALMQLIAPIIYEKVGDGTVLERSLSGGRYLTRSIAVVSILMLVIVLVLGLAQGALFTLLTPPAFWSISHFLPVVALAAGLFVIGQLMTLYCQAFCHTAKLIIPKVGFAVINIILNIYLGKTMGPRGLTIALLISALIYVAWMSGISALEIKRVKVSQSLANIETIMRAK